MREQDFPGFCGRFRRAEQIALHFGATEPAEQFLLPRRFHTLGRGRHVSCGGNIYHGLNDGGSAAFGNIVDEAAIDLDLVEWKRCR